MKKLVFSIFILSTSLGFSQQIRPFDISNSRQGESIEFCSQHVLEDKMAKEDPVAYASFVQSQNQLKREMSSNEGVAKTDVIYYIPVVFHVLHNNGAENISDEQVIDAVRIMNRDFRMQNADVDNVLPQFRGIAADVNIQFRLATKSPNGFCFNGITRTNTPLTNSDNGAMQLQAAFANNDVDRATWSSSMYLNIVVANTIGGAAGYTYRPGNQGDYYNSIFILSNYVGSIGTSNLNSSRSLTHEVGHWLNLPHTWGPNNNPGNMASCATDDGIADTPNTIGVTTCNLAESSCGVLANVENYMDYSYCSKMFTVGQANVMRTAAESNIGNRVNLSTAANLLRVGADGNLSFCKAEFKASKRVVCVGEAVTFTDKSFYGATTRMWDFPGGQANSTSAIEAIVVYDAPGLYPVTLTAGDGTASDVRTKLDYIRVIAPSSIPFFEGFEDISSLEETNGMWTTEGRSDIKFEVVDRGARTGNKAVALKIFPNTSSSGSFDLVSRSFDLSGQTVGDVVLSFRFASRKKQTQNSNDILRLLHSPDCGNTWMNSRTINIANNPVVTTNWTPQPDDYTTFHYLYNASFHEALFTSNYRFKLSMTNGIGNNFYVDDINLYNGSPSEDPVLGVNELSGVEKLTLYPNPSSGEVRVQFDIFNSEKVNVSITDITGKVIKTVNVNAVTGSNVIMFDNTDLAKGSYFISIGTTGGIKVLQFVKM